MVDHSLQNVLCTRLGVYILKYRERKEKEKEKEGSNKEYFSRYNDHFCLYTCNYNNLSMY